MEIHYKKTEVIESDCIFEIKDINNVFLKSKYNYCNAATYPHFAIFLSEDGKNKIIVFIEKYNEVSVKIKQREYYLLGCEIDLKNFIQNQKGDVQEITREEFFKYYNKLTKI